MKLSDSITVFKINQHNIGMFAQLNYCLLLAKYCTEKKLTPYFFLTGKGNVDPNYGDNWFNYYFTHKQLSQKEHRLALRKYENGDYYEINNRYTINRLTRSDMHHEIQNDLTTLQAGKILFDRYINIQDHILNTVDNFYTKNLLNKKVIGIHYRGIDKHKETALVEYDFVISILDKYKNRFNTLFVASDEPEFIKYIHHNITDIDIVTYSNPSGEIHFLDNSNNYKKGLDALVDSILLKRCDLLIKTPSLLSAWSKLLNPGLPVVLLGRPDLHPNNELGIQGYGYYPESVLYQKGYLKKFRNRVKQVILPTNSAA